MRRAVELAREGSRSPAETELYLLLCAPPKQGGYGLTKPELNIPFSLPTQWDALLNTPYILPDLCWPCKKLAMEYDSKRYHSLEQERDRDDDRRCALEELGFTVISLRTKRFMDPHRFDELVRHRVAWPRARAWWCTTASPASAVALSPASQPAAPCRVVCNRDSCACESFAICSEWSVE